MVNVDVYLKLPPFDVSFANCCMSSLHFRAPKSLENTETQSMPFFPFSACVPSAMLVN